MIEGKVERKKPSNWRLVMPESRTAWHIEPTESEPGFSESDTGTVFLIAPSEFIDAYIKEHGEEFSNEAVRDAILEWKDTQEK